MGLLQRLKERKIVQWALAYLAGAFFVYTGLDPARETWGIPETVIRGVHILLIAGFFITLVLAWYHGEKGRQRVSGPELLMVAALLVVAGVALTMLPQEAGGPESGAAESLATLSDDRPGIAVLPCVNHSPDPDDAYLAPSIHDEILLKLGRISAIRSMGRETVEWYRQHPLSPTELATELGVGFVGECSVQNDPNRDQVRLRFQLMDASGAQVWTQDYVRDLTTENLFEIQSDVAQQVAAALQTEIAPDEQTAISSLPTDDLGAYKLIHQARGLWNQRRVAEIREAVGLYESAIGRDPEYADAYAGLGEASLYLGIFSPDREEQIESFRRAVTAAERALELNPHMGGAHAVLGGADLWYEGDWDGAEEEFTTAIALEPDHAFAHYWYSMYLSSFGRHQEALREISIAQHLDPLAQAMSHGPAKLYFHAREYDRAVAEALKDLDVNPDYSTTRFFLCLSYLKLGRLDEARETCEAAQETNQGGDPLVGLYHAVAGDEAAARREVERELEEYGRPTLVSLDVFAVLGDIDEAIRLLRRLQESDAVIQNQLGVHPFLDPLRSDPRFLQILRDMGLEG